MKREDIIAMAREAGAMPYTNRHYPDRPAHAFGIEQLERFAALVAAARDAEHKEAVRWDVHSCGPTCKRYACVAIREAVAAAKAEEREQGQKWFDSVTAQHKQELLVERESCAKLAQSTVCDTHIPTGVKIYGTAAAKAIRARGETK